MDSFNMTQASPSVRETPHIVVARKFAPRPFSEATFLLIEGSLRTWVNGPVACMGVVTNVMVLIIFYRQGIFSNSSTVSLTALGVVDFTCSVLNVWGAVCSGIIFHNPYNYHFYPFSVRDFLFNTSSRPMDMLTQITCWVTAYAAFERLISVIFPFKVKSIFTPKRSLIATICVSVLIFVLYCPSIFGLLPRWDTRVLFGRNVTQIQYFDNRIRFLGMFAYYLLRINTIGLKGTSILVVVCCNVTIYWKVNLSHKFRKTSGTSSASKPTPSVTNDGNEKSSEKDMNKTTTISDKKENKEKKLLKMITAISIVFVTAYTPFMIFAILVTVVWEWRIDYHPFTEYVLWTITTFLQTVNSSTNFFIYYIMSTRFREEFQLCFRRNKL